VTEGISIRHYQEGDLQPVIALWQACELIRPWNDPKRILNSAWLHLPAVF